MKLSKIKLLSLVVALAATLATAQAQVLIGVQFQGTAGPTVGLTSDQIAGVVPQSHWNVQAPSLSVPVTPLMDSTGATTVVSYTLSNFNDGPWYSGTGISTPDSTLLSGKIGAVTGPLTITLSGLLTDGTKYDFYLYTVNNGGPVGVKITAGTTSYYITDQTGAEYTASPGFVQGTATTSGARTVANYVKFSGLTPTGAGTLAISALTDVNYTSAFNGFQIQAVPEPATWALLAFSLTSVMVFRRRRNS